MNSLKDYIKVGFYTLLHPVAGYNEFIEKKAFSKKYSILVAIFFYIAMCFNSLAKGFSFTTSSTRSFDFGITFIVIFGVLILWSLANWAISTLFDGKAKLNQIWFITNVAIIPYTIMLVITTILSNILVSSEGIFITVFLTLGILWSVLLLIVGLMLIQDYSLFAVILSGLCSILAMIIIVILGFLFFNLFKQLYSFISDVIMELSYRFV